MVGRIFALLVSLSFVSSLFTGQIEELQGAIFSGTARAVTVSLALLGMQCLCAGLLSLLRGAGAIGFLSRLLSPFLRLCFPNAEKDPAGREEICLSISANLLGVSNAATPFALSAMQKMQEKNPHKEAPTDDMITLAILNSNAFSLLPTTLLALRAAAGSPSPSRVLPAILAVGLLCTLSAAFLCRLFARFFPYRGVKKR